MLQNKYEIYCILYTLDLLLTQSHDKSNMHNKYYSNKICNMYHTFTLKFSFFFFSLFFPLITVSLFLLFHLYALDYETICNSIKICKENRIESNRIKSDTIFMFVILRDISRKSDSGLFPLYEYTTTFV